MEQTQQEFLQEIVSSVKPYSLVLLIKGPNVSETGRTMDEIQFGHLKHLMNLRKDGILPIHGPTDGDENIVGIGIYNSTDVEQVKKCCEDDPGFKAGRFTYKILPFFTFPGSQLS